MAEAANPRASPLGFQAKYVLAAISSLFLLQGLMGWGHASVGYAFFLIAVLLISTGLALLAVYSLTDWFDTDWLRRIYVAGFWMGAWAYVLAVAAFIGYFSHEAFAGAIEWKYIIFGPLALAAIAILDIGIWRVIVQRNLATIDRFGNLWRREALDKNALRSTLLNEVVLHRTLFGVSRFRWIRHQLIFWGFGLMLMVEVVAVAFREAFPAFGWTDVWHQLDHPLRLTFDLAYDLTGLMILVGCILALVFRVMVNGKEEQKFTDTPTAVFLLIVVFTGFLVEGTRMALAPDISTAGASFVGLAFSVISPKNPAALDALWLIHAAAACGFIAYVPLKRMIHSCATPIGRLFLSQKNLLAEKKMKVLNGLFHRSGRDGQNG